MTTKVILFADKYVENKICQFTIDNPEFGIEIIYISHSYESCIDQLIKLKADAIIFQIFNPIYKTQNFFADLTEINLSPTLLAFKVVSEHEIIYSLTANLNTKLTNKLKDCFQRALQGAYRLQFHYIGESKNSNCIMNARVKNLEKIEYLNDILRGVNKQEFYYYKRKANLDLKDFGYYLYLFNLTDIEYIDHDLNKNIYFIVGDLLIEECKNVLNDYNGGEVFYISPTLLCLIINAVYSKQKQQELSNRLRKVLSLKTGFRYQSGYISQIEGIREAYENFFHLRNYNFFCREADVLTIEYINKTKITVNYPDIENLLQQIKEILYENIADPKLIKLIRILFFDVIKPSLSYNLYYYCSTYLAAIIMMRFRSSYSLKLEENLTPSELFFSSIEQKFSEFIELLHLIKGDHNNQHFRKSPIVINAIDFIHEHYNSDITIHSLAKQLNISNSYLSQIFTKEMGISPRKYLITYRIKKAKELMLTNNMPVYSIAYNVGFLDVKHFSKTFKKLTGLTPMQYKKQHLKI